MNAKRTMIFLGVFLSLAAAASAQTKGAYFYKKFAVTPAFDLFGYDIDLRENSLTCSLSTSAAKRDLRRHSGVPSVFEYRSSTTAYANAVLFGRWFNLLYVNGKATAQHGNHGDYTSSDYRYNSREPVLSRQTTQMLLDQDTVFGEGISVGRTDILLYENSWFFMAGPVPITIYGDVRGGFNLSVQPVAIGRFLYAMKIVNGRWVAERYMRDPETQVTASVTLDAVGSCDGTIGIPGIGVGLGHTIRLASPLTVGITTEASYRRLGGDAWLSIVPLRIGTHVVVKYLIGSKRWKVFDWALAPLTWSKSFM